tara:strand:+ start:1236 stop:1451 length:216 start_codon:yes stop_codon:yes gene_type:complete
MQTITPGIYQHFKGNRYQVIDIVRHSETQEEMVLYKALYGEQGLWVRPLTMFAEIVNRGGVSLPRFSRIVG